MGDILWQNPWAECVVSWNRKATNEQLLESYERIGNIWKVADELGMCGQSVWERLKRLGIDIEDKDRWSEEQLQFLKDAYSVGPDQPIDLAEVAQWIGKSKICVCQKAAKLGLTSQHRSKTAEQCQAMGVRKKKWIAENGHPRGSYKPDNRIRICPSCGRFFDEPPSSRRRFCSRACAYNRRQSQGRQGYARTGKRADLGGQYFRSRWEANYARYLNFLMAQGEPLAKWEYEVETFEFKHIRRGTRFYTPDFKLTFKDGHVEYHEVKGWDYPAGRTARRRFVRCYPDLVLKVVDAAFFKGVKRAGLDALIPGWETIMNEGGVVMAGDAKVSVRAAFA